MENKRGKLVLAVMTLALLLALALGPVAGGVAGQAVEPWDGLHGLCPGAQHAHDRVSRRNRPSV